MRFGHRAQFLVLATTALVALGASNARTDEGRDNSADVRRGPPVGCPVQGVWDLIARTIDGKDVPLNGSRERKVVTARHFMWVAHAGGRDTLPMETELERLRALKFEGGAGTYSTSGSTYIEYNELYDNAREIGTSFRATCRVTGSRWEHIFTIPNDTTKSAGQILHFVQVYRRVE
jgi:hypothetical protein